MRLGRSKKQLGVKSIQLSCPPAREAPPTKKATWRTCSTVSGSM